MLEQALIKDSFSENYLFFFTELPAQVKHYDIKSLLVPGIKNNHYCVKRSLQCYKRMQIVVEGSQRANDRGFLPGRFRRVQQCRLEVKQGEAKRVLTSDMEARWL